MVVLAPWEMSAQRGVSSDQSFCLGGLREGAKFNGNMFSTIAKKHAFGDPGAFLDDSLSYFLPLAHGCVADITHCRLASKLIASFLELKNLVTPRTGSE
jgi:hypothetical protein